MKVSSLSSLTGDMTEMYTIFTGQYALNVANLLRQGSQEREATVQNL